MRPVRVPASVVALLCAGPVAAQSQSAISYEWAEAVSAEAAGQHLLGPLAQLYPNFSGPQTGHFSRGRLEGVAFASRPRESGMYGMCEADIIWLTFREDPATPWSIPADGGAETAPVVTSAVRSETRFREIADTASRPWTDSYEAEIGAACATLTDGWEFGIADDAIDAWIAVRVQTTLPDPAADKPAALLELLDSCVGEECTAPLSLVAQLRTARFWSVDIDPCDPLVDIYRAPRFDGPFCLKARYLLDQQENESEWLTVSARFEMRYSADQSITLDPLLSDIRLERESIIED